MVLVDEAGDDVGLVGVSVVVDGDGTVVGAVVVTTDAGVADGEEESLPCAVNTAA